MKRFALPALLLSMSLACSPDMGVAGKPTDAGGNIIKSPPEINRAPQNNNIKLVLGDASLPKKVKEAVRNSEVWVEVSFESGTPLDLLRGSALLAGSVVGDNLVLTCYHALLSSNGIREQGATLKVGWDGNTLPAEIVYKDPGQDELLLKFLDPQNLLKKKPVVFEKTDGVGERRLPWFAFGLIEEDFIVPREFHRFLGYLRDGWIRRAGAASSERVMVLDEGLQPGFSGAPVFDSDGRCRGIVSRSWQVASAIIGADQIQFFLESYKLGSPPRLLPKLLMPSPK